MSRPSVFRRVASWLKKTANLNQYRCNREAQTRACRTYSFQALEDRHMLDASFDYDSAADRLTFNNFSEVFGESINISETTEDFRFLLTEGTWSGTDDPVDGITGNGTADLRLRKDPLGPGSPMSVDTIVIDDGVGVDLLFDGVNFSNPENTLTNFIVNSTRGDIEQTALSSNQFVNFTVDGADNIDLREVANQFSLVTLTDTNNAKIRDGFSLDLGRIQVNQDCDFENDGFLQLTQPVDVGGNLYLNANEGDIRQTVRAGVIVQGETYLKSNFAGEFGIDFGFGDRDNDGLNDNDFVGAVNVLQGAQIEIVDANALIVGDVTTHDRADREVFQFYGEAENGSVTVAGAVSVTGSADAVGKVILRSTNGITETNQGIIIADDLVLIGDGNFILDKANEIYDHDLARESQDPSGYIIGDVTGNLLFNNEFDLLVADNTFEFASERDPAGGNNNPPIVVDINALKVRSNPDGSGGNMILTTSDDNLGQLSTAPVIIEKDTTVNVGTGNVTWNTGDELGDLKNDNNWNRILVESATNASFVDEDSIEVGDVSVANNARFKTENDTPLFLDGEVVAQNNLLFQTNIGLSQLSGSVTAAGLMVQGSGSFIFDQTNSLGDTGVSGKVAADLRGGEFFVDNLHGIQVTTLSAFGETITGIGGVQVDKSRLRGDAIQVDQVVNADELLFESETTITQTAVITAGTLMIHSNGDVLLDTVANSVDGIAADIEGDFNYNGSTGFTVGNLTYDSTTIAGISVQNGVTNNFNLTIADDDVHQFLDAPVIVEELLTINIGTGWLDFAEGDGNGDGVNDNDFGFVTVGSAGRIELVDHNDFTANEIVVDEQLRLKSDTGTLNLEGDLVAPNIILLQAGDGVQQRPVDPEELLFDAADPLVVDIVNDTFTIPSHGYTDGTAVFYNIPEDGTGTEIGGLTNGEKYYVTELAGGTFKLALEAGGPAIDLTDLGIGVHNLDDADGVKRIINTAALMIEGDGVFYLDHPNEIGSETTKGEIAVDINGSLELRNRFELITKALQFELADGSTHTINGFEIDTGGDALVLNVSGLTIEKEIVAPKIIINSIGDVVQAPTGRLVTNELVLMGVGDFDLTAPNQIGTAFTPGVVAIQVEGDVELVNDFALNFGEIVNGTQTYLGASLSPGVFLEGNLTLRTGGHITQTDNSVFSVEGAATFDTGAANVSLHGFADHENNFNELIFASGNIVEIVDTDEVILESTNVADKMVLIAGATNPAQIVLDDNISVGNQLLLKADIGVSQQRGFITVDTLLLDGVSDFTLANANEINQLGVAIAGNLELNNEVDLTIVKDEYLDLNGEVTSFVGVVVDSGFFDGNLQVTTNNGTVTQNTDAHLQVADTAAFNLGSGNLDLVYGDSNADLLNDNDINVLAITSAANAEVVDQDSIGLDNINVAGSLFVQSESGSISIQGEVSADDRIMLHSFTGAGTSMGASLSTDNLLVSGQGEFNLKGANRIGGGATPGNLAVDVDGNLILHNNYAVHFEDITFSRLDGSLEQIVGANVDASAFYNGNLFVNAAGGVTDSDTVNIVAEGHAAFVASAGSDVNLGGGGNQVMAESVGLGGRNVSLWLNNELVLDGVAVSGDLFVQSIGDITQSAVDVSEMAGSRYVNVDGTATFLVDSVSGLTEDRDINLLSSNGDLLNNRFGGATILQGTSFTGAGNGQLGNVQVRNAVSETAVFPTINRLAGDALTNLSVWAPNSSLSLGNLGAGTDYDVVGNMTVFAGVDSDSGRVGGQLKVTDNTKTRSLRDDAGVEINVGGNLNTNAANTLTLADEASNTIQVGGSLSLVNQGGSNENRIRIGVGGGSRGTDSGATVSAATLRTRANRNGTDGHVTVNLDSDVNFTNSNFATSLVVVAGGEITDEAAASISVANSAFFEANDGNSDITIGDNNSTNRTIFGSVGFKGHDVSFSEDTSALLNGSKITGNFDAFSKGLRQSGVDRQGRAGTDFIEVAGDSLFTVEANSLPQNHLSDVAGRDVMLLSDGSQNLMDNSFEGAITIQSTQYISGGNGTVRNVAIRNLVENAATPEFSVDATDQLRSLTIWHPNASVSLTEQANATDYDVAGNLMIVAGLDSDNGKMNGNKVIVNESVVRDIVDDNDLVINVGRHASYYAANHISLVSDASSSLLVGRTATFVSKGGLQGNQIDVGTSGARGNDSGGTFETRRLKFTIEDTGVGGDLTIVADQNFFLDPVSTAPSVVLKP
ncbi:MAG: hypothetical protein VX438_10395 [Planctomycetota bacterium]|nr:hypothetical protein [Planctomycetota bacterium]